jgi:hypothetical protein
MPWWNRWDELLAYLIAIWALWVFGRMATDVRAMREMTEELVQWTRNRTNP